MAHHSGKPAVIPSGVKDNVAGFFTGGHTGRPYRMH